MQWPNLQQLSSAKTSSTLVLLIVVLILNGWTAYIDTSNKNSIWQLRTSSHQSIEQIKQIDANLKSIANQLQQDVVLSHRSSQQITAELSSLQSAIEKLPTQQDVTQMQNSLNQLHETLTAKNTAATALSAHATPAHKHHLRPHHLLPKALPFKVVSIDIWNGITQATITQDGAPELLAKGDSVLGWTLTALSFDLNMAVFKNKHGQQVIVHVT